MEIKTIQDVLNEKGCNTKYRELLERDAKQLVKLKVLKNSDMPSDNFVNGFLEDSFLAKIVLKHLEYEKTKNKISLDDISLYVYQYGFYGEDTVCFIIDNIMKPKACGYTELY